MEYDPKTFLGSDYKNVNLKFVFDHLRNVGICAAIMGAGAFYSENPEAEKINVFDLDLFLVGRLTIIIGAVLLMANFIQGVYIGLNSGSKLRGIGVIAVSFPVYVFTAYVAIAYALPV